MTEKNETIQTRKHYRTPTLRRYGNIQELTATTSIFVDGKDSGGASGSKTGL